MPMTLQEIERMIDQGARVEAVESLIDQLPIEPDAKSALWLRAWARNRDEPVRKPVPGLFMG